MAHPVLRTARMRRCSRPVGFASALLCATAAAAVGHAQEVDSPMVVPLRVEGPSTPPSVARAARALRRDLAFVPELRVGRRGPMRVEVAGRRDGERVLLDMSLHGLADGEPVVRTFEGLPLDTIPFVHRFANAIVERTVGRPGIFGSRIVFGRRMGRGRKDVVALSFPYGGVSRLSSGAAFATLPAIGPHEVWYTIMDPRGMFITHTGAAEAPVIDAPGIDMGVAVCGGRVLFTSSRSGDPEIWSAGPDGADPVRLTHDPGIDVSPTCLPDGRVAFVSNRGGTPQIWAVDAGGGEPSRLTPEGPASQTPTACAMPDGTTLLAFTRVHGPTSVQTLDLTTGRVETVARGNAKDPAFSPDCRMLAYATPAGLVVAEPTGRRPKVLLRGSVETVRWGW